MDSIDQTISRFCYAWNRHDPADLAAIWTEDGELHHPWGQRLVGRDAILERLREEHTGTMASSALAIRSVTASGDDHTVSAEIEGLLIGVRAPNGRPYDLPHVMSALFVRAGDEWQIRAMTPVANARGKDA